MTQQGTIRLDENQRIEIIVPDCPYCGQPIVGEVRDGMHVLCAIEFADEWDKIMTLCE
jgi:hypothetical protein